MEHLLGNRSQFNYNWRLHHASHPCTHIQYFNTFQSIHHIQKFWIHLFWLLGRYSDLTPWILYLSNIAQHSSSHAMRRSNSCVEKPRMRVSKSTRITVELTTKRSEWAYEGKEWCFYAKSLLLREFFVLWLSDFTFKESPKDISP